MKRDTTLVFFSDLHVGHPFALCPERWTLHDGNEFTPNALQKIIRQHWRDTWEQVAEQRAGRRLIACLVGDACEGVHHNTTQLITARQDTQENMAAAVIREGLELAHFDSKADLFYVVTGSSAHDGQGAASLERIARQVLEYDGDRRQTRDYLRLRVNGVLFDVAHHPAAGPGTRNWVRGNAFQAWLRSVYLDALESGLPPPRFIVRGHRHIYTERHVHNSSGDPVLTGYILPSWQAKTEYVYTLAPEAITHIGALVINIGKDGTVGATRCWRLRVVPSQDEIEDV